MITGLHGVLWTTLQLVSFRRRWRSPTTPSPFEGPTIIRTSVIAGQALLANGSIHRIPKKRRLEGLLALSVLTLKHASSELFRFHRLARRSKLLPSSILRSCDGEKSSGISCDRPLSRYRWTEHAEVHLQVFVMDSKHLSCRYSERALPTFRSTSQCSNATI